MLKILGSRSWCSRGGWRRSWPPSCPSTLPSIYGLECSSAHASTKFPGKSPFSPTWNYPKILLLYSLFDLYLHHLYFILLDLHYPSYIMPWPPISQLYLALSSNICIISYLDLQYLHYILPWPPISAFYHALTSNIYILSCLYLQYL